MTAYMSQPRRWRNVFLWRQLFWLPFWRNDNVIGIQQSVLLATAGASMLAWLLRAPLVPAPLLGLLASASLIIVTDRGDKAVREQIAVLRPAGMFSVCLRAGEEVSLLMPLSGLAAPARIMADMRVRGDGVGFELGFDHARILADAVERLRSKLEYTHIAVHLLPKEFTLPELQRTYEIILQQPLDKSSFRRRVVQADMLEEAPHKQRDGSGRPAQLYRFRDYDRQTFFPRSISRHAR